MRDLPQAKRFRPLYSGIGMGKPEAKGVGTGLRTSTVVCMLVVGVLVILNVMLRFPELGALIERYNQY